MISAAHPAETITQNVLRAVHAERHLQRRKWGDAHDERMEQSEPGHLVQMLARYADELTNRVLNCGEPGEQEVDLAHQTEEVLLLRVAAFACAELERRGRAEQGVEPFPGGCAPEQDETGADLDSQEAER